MGIMRYMKFPRADKLIALDSGSKFISILLIALVLRLIGIASRPIWYDEAFSILFSEKGPGAMLYGTLAPTGAGSADIHPLGYYTLLWLWMRVFGESLIAARALSILAGLATTGLVYLLARELFDLATAEAAMLFSAMSPYQIHYSQEIRMYSFLALWLLIAAYAFVRGARTGGWQWWILFCVTSALAQYTHNLAAFFLVAIALIPILQNDWRTFLRLALAGFFAIILYLPWLVQLPAQFAKIQLAYWVERPALWRLLTLVIVYVTNTPLPDSWIVFALLIGLASVSIGVLQTVKAFPKAQTGNGILALYLSFAPPLFLFVFSQWRPVYIERALLPSGAIFCIWLAWAINDTKLKHTARNLMLGMLAIASIMGIYEHVTYRDFPYAPFQALDISLKNRLEPGDVIVHSNKLTMLPAMLFDRDLPQKFIADLPGSGADTLAPATQQVLGIEAEPDIAAATTGAERVWYIIYQRAIEELEANGGARHPDLEYLDSKFVLAAQEGWDGLQVFFYEKQP